MPDRRPQRPARSDVQWCAPSASPGVMPGQTCLGATPAKTLGYAAVSGPPELTRNRRGLLASPQRPTNPGWYGSKIAGVSSAPSCTSRYAAANARHAAAAAQRTQAAAMQQTRRRPLESPPPQRRALSIPQASLRSLGWQAP